MYRIGAVEDYKNGDYFSAAEMTQHYFNLYGVFNNFATESKDVNNIMHIMKLLLQHRWTLSTNRDFAINALKLIAVFEDNYSENVDFSFWEEEYDNEIIKELYEYFKGIILFHDENYEEAIERFETCYKTCSDKLLQEYCSLMVIRTAFWNFDKERTQENLKLFKKLYSSYSPTISLPYFLPDLKKYENVVKKIASNPDYSG
jgi:tetratricopeptide (TPR) repeat protein